MRDPRHRHRAPPSAGGGYTPDPMTDALTPDEPIDETLDESFPASDPPQWTGTHAGLPAATGVGQVPPSPDLVTVRCAGGFEESVGAVERALAGAGMKLFAKIDHAAEARAVGLALGPAVVLVFGSAKAGTALMAARPTSAIDLPLKALLWEDGSGAVWLTYNTPALLARRHGVDEALANKLAPAAGLLEKAVGADSRRETVGARPR
jgi:uncharacterized protein (DUF302 family)